jgi:hypothetical protein
MLPGLCLCADSGIQHILCCVFFWSWFFFLRLLCPMLPVSLDCSFLIAPSDFSNVYLDSTIISEHHAMHRVNEIRCRFFNC